MSRHLARALSTLVAAGGICAGTAAPALAAQAYPAPGVPSEHASCVGAALAFGAHYGVNGSTFPEITHGEVGPAISEHATNDGPGAVGAFNSTLAQSHGDIGSCMP